MRRHFDLKHHFLCPVKGAKPGHAGWRGLCRPATPRGMSDSPDDPWEQAWSAQHLADEIAALVARAREAGIDDETVLARLQEAANTLREGLT